MIFKSGLLLAISSSGATFTTFLLIIGCLLIHINSLAISLGAKTKSTTPSAIAELGILLNLAESSWAKVIPPANFISLKPRVPSLALPDNTTPITFSLWVSAKEENNTSMERLVILFLRRGNNFMCPSTTSISLL